MPTANNTAIITLTQHDQASAGVLPGVGSDEAFERVKRLGNDLRHLRKRWDNRLVLKDGTFREVYLNGRAEIVVYGDWGVGSDDANWAVRIPAKRAIFDSIGANPGVDVFDFYDGDRRNEIIVFVEVPQMGRGPKVEIRVPARLYFFEDKFRGIGEDLLYRRVVGGEFKVFPFFRKREVGLHRLAGGLQGSVNPVVKSLPKIVDGVSDDRAKVIYDWLFGPVGQLKTIRLGEGDDRSGGSIRNLVQLFGQGGRVTDNLINVAVGPFDL